MRRWLILLPLTLTTLSVRAHTVPSITMEAEFAADRSYTLRINLDPRLFLSTKPTELPPVEAKWWRDQSPEELKATQARAADYLRTTLSVIFGDKPVPLPELSFQPIDGGTNQPMAATTAEVHLLATAKGIAADSAFKVALLREANSSLILLNSFAGQPERRPQVLFPGETGRAFNVPGKP